METFFKITIFLVLCMIFPALAAIVAVALLIFMMGGLK
jgi:hypothetical protein